MAVRHSIVAVSLIVMVAGLVGQPPSSAASEAIHEVPGSIAADCSADVTDELLAWIATVPDQATLRFGTDACYRVDGSLRIEDRWGLTFDGNGATFRAVSDGDRDRRHWWFFGGGDLTMQDLTVIGANPEGGTSEPAYQPDRAFQHAFALQGVHGARLQRVAAYDVYGDFVYIGPDGAGHRTAKHGWSQDIEVVDSTFARNGRQGIATVAARDVLIARNDLRDVRRAIFNLEPSASDWGAERVTIEDNVTGRSRLLWLSSGGQGSNVRDIVVRRNRMEEHSGTPVIHLVAPEGHERGPITIADNYLMIGGSPAPGFRLIRVRDVTITGNRAVLPAGREMTAVYLDQVRGAVLDGNVFDGAATELEAIGSTDVVHRAFAGFAGPPEGHRFHDAIAWMVAEEVTGGFEDGTFRPNAAVSRQAVAAFLYRLAGEPPVSGKTGFSDVPSGR